MSTSPRLKKALKLGLELLLVALVVLGIRAYQQRDIVEGIAPPIEAEMLDGDGFSLARWRGEPVLVHFWATWCPICAAEQESIADIAQSHRVIAVAMQSGDADTLRAWVREHDWPVPVVVDEDGGIARRYGVRGVPTSFVLDGEGNIRFVEVGYTTGLGLRLRLWFAGQG